MIKKEKKDKKEDIKDRIQEKNLSWIPFIVCFAFMIPITVWLYPEILIKAYFAIDIHSDMILSVAGLVFAGAVFIKFDNWLRSIGREKRRKSRGTNMKQIIPKSVPDIYDIKLDKPKFNFQKRNREVSNKQLGNYRHESMLRSDDMDKLDQIMNRSSDMAGIHNHGSRLGAKRAGRR